MNECGDIVAYALSILCVLPCVCVCVYIYIYVCTQEHSTIIYECPQRDTPLLRLGWNKQDSRYMATIIMDQAKVIILDIRFPTCPVAELTRHQVRQLTDDVLIHACAPL